MRPNVCAFRLLVAIVSLAGVACSTTSAMTKVQRAPAISFKGAKTVSVAITTACTETEAKAGLAAQQTSCANWPVNQQLASNMAGQLEQRLRAQGYDVVHGPADRALQVAIEVQRIRKVEPWGDDHKDEKGDQTCQKLCGRPMCKSYQQTGQLEVSTVFVGPPSPERTTARRVQRSHQFDALVHSNINTGVVGGRYVYACDNRASDEYMNDGHFDWSGASSNALEWLNKSLANLFSTHTEEYEVTLLKVDDSPQNDTGLDAGKRGDWQGALASFTAALQATTNAEAKPRLLHNVAAAEMTLGKLDDAKAHADQARMGGAGEDTDDLSREITRRLIDQRKL